MGLSPPAQIAPEPHEARRCAKLPGFFLLHAGDCQRAFEIALRPGQIGLGRQQLDFAGNAMGFRVCAIVRRTPPP